MNDISTTYISFSSIDYKGDNILSSYALSGTPLTFIPDIPISEYNKVYWTFGDGTYFEGISAKKYYKYPS